ncbi:MAG: phosphoribosylanthranilate isomerase [Kofleriaceae bacterium]|nr:phosphoribosylanthranilate isomerase [Kofleriaceae bacterium]
MAPAVKICGVTSVADAAAVAAAGADYLGLNFWPRSKRVVTAAAAPALAAAARAAAPTVGIVGVFVDAGVDDVVAIAAAVGLDVVQLHGDEPAAACAEIARRTGRPVWKAVPVAAAADVAPAALAAWPVAALLLDAATAARGGSGLTIDWTLAATAARGATPIVLAGGLRPDNVAAAVRAVRPWAVDVASGVERAPGIKDPDRVAAFVAAARGAGTEEDPR